MLRTCTQVLNGVQGQASTPGRPAKLSKHRMGLFGPATGLLRYSVTDAYVSL